MPVDFDKYSEGHKGAVTMEDIVNCSYPPESNHFGSYIGGAGIALLAIRGDAGADAERVERYLETIERQAIRLMTEGFGDHGFFAEGHGPSHMAANPAFVPFLQAAHVAWGKDFISPRPNGQWLTLRWVMEIVPDEEGRPWYPNYHPSSYGPMFVDRDGVSDGGEFCQGFGALANDDQRAALLWVYRNSVEPGWACARRSSGASWPSGGRRTSSRETTAAGCSPFSPASRGFRRSLWTTAGKPGRRAWW